MFEDGDEEYYRITKVEPNPYIDFNHDKLMTNTYIVASMILQEGLNQIELNTRAVVYDYINAVREDSNYELPFYKVIKFVEQGIDLFEK